MTNNFTKIVAYDEHGNIYTLWDSATWYGWNKSLETNDEYKQAESEGRLIVLPCKVGDTVFEITNLPGDDAIQMRFVAEIAWLSGHGTVLLSSGLVIGLDEFGKTVFLTREEAEAALGGEAT